MNVVPKKTNERIEFYENHIAPFTTNATAIGTTTAAVTNLSAKAVAARGAYEAQQVAQQTAKATTATLKTAMRALQDAGASIIDQIRAKARLSGDGVFNLAEIPVPATPTNRPVPGTPFDFAVDLQPNGTLETSWKCNNPLGSQGTLYQVFRRVGGTGEFTYLGGSGLKKFIDATIPAGATQLTYQVQAVRSTAIGIFAEFNVNFGTNAGGTSFAKIADATTKLAA